MKSNPFKILAILVGVFLTGSLSAQYESWDAVYQKIIKEYTLEPDGRIVFRYVKEQKLQTYRAFHSLYGETFIIRDTTRQELKINEVYTVMADGKKIPTPANAFNDVLPDYAANAPAYNALREMVITHTGLERGATIHLDYQLTTRKGNLPALAGYEILAEKEPVISYEIHIRIPSGTKLNFHLMNSEKKPVVNPDGLYQRYSWVFNDVPALSAEENQPAVSQAPALLFTTAVKMEDVLNWWTAQPAFSFQISEEMKTAVNRLKEEKKDRWMQVFRMQEIVTDEIRYYPVPASAALYSLRTPEACWNSAGATTSEKAVLLTSLLLYAGFDAQVACIAKSQLAGLKMGIPDILEDFCVRVDMKEKGIWYLSVTENNSTNLRNTLSERSMFLIDNNQKFSVENSAVAGYNIVVNGNFIVSSDPALTGEVSLYMNNAAYPQFGLLRDWKKMRNTLSGQLIKSDSSALKKSVINNDNGSQTFILQSDKPFKSDSNLYFFRLPVVSTGVEGWYLRYASEKRAAPFEIPARADERYLFTIALPDGMTLFTPEKSMNISNKAGTFTFELKNDNGKVKIERSLKLTEKIIPVSLYADFKALMDYWNHPWYRQVVFVKK
jgi:hypothetical protein